MNFFKFFSKFFLGIFFPSHCISCEEIISKDALFCGPCWQKLSFITEPKCKICSYPFEVEISFMQPLCAKCLVKKPAFDKVITLFRYNSTIKKIIGDLKYRDQSFLAKKLAKILFDKIKNEIASHDLIIAVPLHPKRLKKRKFNQAILLAKNLVKFSPNLKFFPDFLFRVKDTKPQAQLRKQQREKNLKRGFLVNKIYQDSLKDKKVLLIDDVMTTGATLENCAKELKRRGAREVVVLVIAKTIFFNHGQN